MEDFLILTALSAAMFAGSYVAGLLPLIVSFSESKLRLVTIIGAGLLVGTALAVIIPEGVHSIYTAQSEAVHELAQRNVKPVTSAQVLTQNLNREQLPLIEETLPKRVEKDLKERVELTKPDPALAKDTEAKNSVLSEPILSGLPSGLSRLKREATREEIAGHHHGSNDHRDIHDKRINVDVHHTVGLALVAGFVLMLLVDQLAQSRTTRIDAESGAVVQQARHKITATIGLVVHAAADGVALGAASGSSHADVQFIVFLAIMLHKAPASFGLVTFLLHENLDKIRIKRHLLIFSSSAPLAALITYIFIVKGGPASLTSLHSTGVLLLFSAGTFLYVATVHVLPEVASTGGHSHGSGQPGSANSGTGGLKFNELIALVIGAISPTLLTVGHSH